MNPRGPLRVICSGFADPGFAASASVQPVAAGCGPSVQLDLAEHDVCAPYAYDVRCCASRGSKVFLQLKHNLSLTGQRGWSYWFGPDVDLLEIKSDSTIVAYELKGARKSKSGIEWPAYYDGLGQALAYLNLPVVWENNQSKFKGGAFDYIYLIHARPKVELSDDERRILNLVPLIGFGGVLPDGTFTKILEPKENPISDKEAKSHFLANLDTLNKFSTSSRTFRRVKRIGEAYLGG